MPKTQSPQDIFIEGWGRMGSCWGISKVMAEIYALLYLSPRALTLDEMSEKLRTSRSNVSINVRGLVDLGVVRKEVVRGDRRDYYTAESDVAKVAKLLALAKKRRELDPAVEIVERALEAARDEAAPDGETALTVERLAELKRHMDFVDAIFHTFVGSDPAGSLDTLRRLRDDAPGGTP